MSFKEFGADLKGNKIKNVCLLWGKENFLTEWAEGELVKRFSNEISRQFDVVEFDGEEADMYKIVEACETLPFYSEKKVVIVDSLPSLCGKSASDGEDALLKYLKSPSESTILIFTCEEKIDKRRSVYKALAKSGSVYEFDSLSYKDLERWVKKRLKSHHKTISERDLFLLIEFSGYPYKEPNSRFDASDKDEDYTLYNLENDVSKVILHSEGEVISGDDIKNTISGNLNANVFKMIDFIGAGKKREAFDMLSDLFLYGQSEYGMLALLWRQYENVLNVKQLMREGKSRKDIAGLLKAKDFVVGKWIDLGRYYSEEKLKSILQSIYNGDKLIKNGEMESRMVLELLIGTI